MFRGIFSQIQGWITIKDPTTGDKVNVGTKEDGTTKALHVIGQSQFGYAGLLELVVSSGFLAGESYDQIVYEEDGGQGFFFFNLADIAQFEVVVMVTDQQNFTISKETPTGFLLQENGDKILQETGDAVLTEGKIPI